MTPVERLQAAIEKLERLKNESTPGPWLLADANAAEERVYGPLWVVTHESLSTDRADGEAPEEWFLELRIGAREDGDLIVALHRTIDAQLAILRFGLQRQYAVDWTRRTFTANDKQLEAAGLELALAEAIIGTTPAPALTEREFAEVARFGIHPELGDES